MRKRNPVRNLLLLELIQFRNRLAEMRWRLKDDQYTTLERAKRYKIESNCNRKRRYIKAPKGTLQ